MAVAVLAVLVGTGTCAYLLTRTPTPDDTARTRIVSTLPTEGQPSVGAHPSAAPSADHSSTTEPAAASADAHRFLTYDAATGKYGYADKTGAMVIEPRFQRAGQFVEGLAPVQLQSDSGAVEYGYIDTSGAVVIEPLFETAFAFCQGLARVEVGIDGLYRYGFIDRSGAMVIEPRYIEAWDFSQGLARVVSSDASGSTGYGFIDRTGVMVIEPRFGSARDFSEGLAAVAVDDRWGYIDRAGNWIIEPRFPYAESFVASGLAAVDLEDPETALGEKAPAFDALGLHQALIDKTGEVVWRREREEE